jgi:hypothetical protein
MTSKIILFLKVEPDSPLTSDDILRLLASISGAAKKEGAKICEENWSWIEYDQYSILNPL